MQRPGSTSGLRHVALYIQNFEKCLTFYIEMLGMRIEWAPDPDNIYLTSGVDNLALHRAKFGDFSSAQRLDHIGFILETPEAVDAWHAFFINRGVEVKCTPRTHRDGARSFYCLDPDGNAIQMIYHPPLSRGPSFLI